MANVNFATYQKGELTILSTDQLTVQDLIDTLLKIEDKSSDIRIQTQRDTDDGYFENQWLSSVDVVTNGYDDRDENYNAFKDVMLIFSTKNS